MLKAIFWCLYKKSIQGPARLRKQQYRVGKGRNLITPAIGKGKEIVIVQRQDFDMKNNGFDSHKRKNFWTSDR